MTAPVNTVHCPHWQLCIPATPLIGDWTLDNEAPRHSHNYRGANILIGDKLPGKLSKHVAGHKVGQNTSIDTWREQGGHFHYNQDRL